LFRAFNFSDCTVRATIIETPDDFLPIFLHELYILVNEQCRFVCTDNGDFPVLLRGGVTMGLLDVHPGTPERDVIFGPALVRAHELESSAAIFPRIVIDHTVVKEAREQDAIRVGKGTSSLFDKRLVSLSEDGVYFVDYLNACEDHSYGNILVFGGGGMSFDTHKRMIEGQLKELKEKRKSERIIQKYLWLAHYHNSRVDTIPDERFCAPDKRTRESLCVSEESLGLLK
jgi:hypothetical protein